MPLIAFVSFTPLVHELLRGNPEKRSGGAGIQQVLVCRELARRGLPVHFVAPAVGSEMEVFDSDGVSVTAGILPAQGIRFIRAFRPLTTVFRCLNSVRPEVCHTWGTFRGPGFVALYCMLKRIPFIFSIYNNRDVDGTSLKSMGLLDRVLFRFVLRRAAAVFAETNYELDLLRRNHGREGVLIRNICRVADDADARSKRDFILWVGQFRDEKRPWMFADLATRFPEHRFIMIGGEHGSNPTLFGKIAERASRLGNLELTGQLPYDRTQEHYRRAKLMVLTSDSEGFPNVMLESWRVGTPVVSTFDPDGVIARHEIGLSCADATGLEQSVRSLLEQDDLRTEMGRRAVEYVRQNHDPDSMATEILTAILRLTDLNLEGHSE